MSHSTKITELRVEIMGPELWLSEHRLRVGWLSMPILG